MRGKPHYKRIMPTPTSGLLSSSNRTRSETVSSCMYNVAMCMLVLLGCLIISFQAPWRNPVVKIAWKPTGSPKWEYGDTQICTQTKTDLSIYVDRAELCGYVKPRREFQYMDTSELIKGTASGGVDTWYVVALKGVTRYSVYLMSNVNQPVRIYTGVKPEYTHCDADNLQNKKDVHRCGSAHSNKFHNMLVNNYDFDDFKCEHGTSRITPHKWSTGVRMTTAVGNMPPSAHNQAYDLFKVVGRYDPTQFRVGQPVLRYKMKHMFVYRCCLYTCILPNPFVFLIQTLLRVYATRTGCAGTGTSHRGDCDGLLPSHIRRSSTLLNDGIALRIRVYLRRDGHDRSSGVLGAKNTYGTIRLRYRAVLFNIGWTIDYDWMAMFDEHLNTRTIPFGYSIDAKEVRMRLYLSHSRYICGSRMVPLYIPCSDNDLFGEFMYQIYYVAILCYTMVVCNEKRSRPGNSGGIYYVR